MPPSIKGRRHSAVNLTKALADPPSGMPANAAFVSDPADAGRIVLIRKAPDAPGWTRQRISSGAVTPTTARPEARTLRTACTNANLAEVDFRSV